MPPHPAAPTNQEAAFLDYVERIGKSRAERWVTFVHLSQLSPAYRQPHHLRIASATFELIIDKFEGTLFRLSNDDLVVCCKGDCETMLNKAAEQVKALFRKDAALACAKSGEAQFVEVFDVEHDYPALLNYAQVLNERRSAGMESIATKRSAPPPRPMQPSDLQAIMTAIAQADLSGMIRRQPVCILAQGQPPKPVFFEVFTSIEILRQTLVPDIDILANRWLFQDLSRILDKRLIAHLARRDDDIMTRAFSLNLNVETLMTAAFLDLDEAMSSAMRRTIVIELQLHDVFADISAFQFAREFLSGRGYRFCLDGLTHLTLPLIDRERLGFDLVKVFWSPDLHAHATGPKSAALREAAESVGQGRLILARCDSEAAIETGDALGALLYQGHLIDAMLNKKMSPEAFVRAKREQESRPQAAAGTR
ncbi:MAG: hypothetical protein D6826_03350 [Alphaproteobacteria bacterium]|nr:MAG: hypothetical protein D6826_03350 [Alphaproteobacteria bacterium]